jgi:D-threo-aldose 1-dehydrogenase
VPQRDRITAVCQRHGADIRSAALQFCAAHPVVAAIIPGAKRAEKVEENARLMATTVPAGVWQEFKDEQLIPANAATHN